MNTSKLYNGPALAYKEDPNHRKKMNKKKFIISDLNEWRGEKDIEEICHLFMSFLTTPTGATHARLEREAKEAEENRIRRIQEAEEKKRKEELKKLGLYEESPEPNLN